MNYLFRPYQKVIEFRDNFCTPKPIKDCIVSENELITPIQCIGDHQLTKLFKIKPHLKNELEIIKEEHPTAEPEAVIKYGKYDISFNSMYYR